ERERRTTQSDLRLNAASELREITDAERGKVSRVEGRADESGKLCATDIAVGCVDRADLRPRGLHEQLAIHEHDARPHAGDDAVLGIEIELVEPVARRRAGHATLPALEARIDPRSDNRKIVTEAELSRELVGKIELGSELLDFGRAPGGALVRRVRRLD